MNGAAARIHGYEALDGFGMTLIKNQSVEVIPIKRKVILAISPLLLLKLNIFSNLKFFNALILNLLIFLIFYVC